MTSYAIAAFNADHHLLEIEVKFIARDKSTTVQIPYWRPGRYEGGNFPRNYLNFEAFCKGRQIESRKATSQQWHLKTEIGEEIVLKYDCNAAELSAGNTYFDQDLLLINPVNCLLYVAGFEGEPCRLSLKIFDSWKIATAMMPGSSDTHLDGEYNYECADIQELLDTPILAASQIETRTYVENGIDFHVHFSGKGVVDRPKLLNEFQAFTRAQLQAFGSFPVDRYHFLLVFLPYKAYHGVEHESSTVIILGPSEDLDRPEVYKELLGISSHELYHTWNVKSLRPSDWVPYDFTGPSFSRLGYVAEGVTTYMGDYMLWLSGVFDNAQFLHELAMQLQKHLHNEGRFNLSLGDASIDTWTDGYGRGVPRRRVSIYAEGALLALVCDIWLINASEGNLSLTEIMRRLYVKHGGKRGYSESDYWSAFHEAANLPWNQLRDDVVDGKGKLEAYVRDALASVGLEIEETPSMHRWEDQWGMSIQKVNENWVVWNILKDSPAEKAGIWFNDIVLEIDDLPAEEFFTMPHSITKSEISIRVQSGFNFKQGLIQTDGNHWLQKLSIKASGDEGYQFLKKWSSILAITESSN